MHHGRAGLLGSPVYGKRYSDTFEARRCSSRSHIYRIGHVHPKPHFLITKNLRVNKDHNAEWEKIQFIIDLGKSSVCFRKPAGRKSIRSRLSPFGCFPFYSFPLLRQCLCSLIKGALQRVGHQYWIYPKILSLLLWYCGGPFNKPQGHLIPWYERYI